MHLFPMIEKEKKEKEFVFFPLEALSHSVPLSITPSDVTLKVYHALRFKGQFSAIVECDVVTDVTAIIINNRGIRRSGNEISEKEEGEKGGGRKEEEEEKAG